MADLDRLDLDEEFLRRCPVCGEDEWDDELHVDCRAEEVAKIPFDSIGCLSDILR